MFVIIIIIIIIIIWYLMIFWKGTTFPVYGIVWLEEVDYVGGCIPTILQ
jgi:hypothetical protein